MKFILIVLAAALIPSLASASCRVTKMHYNSYFEEGLSEHEYPDVEFYKGTLYIGSAAYSAKDGDKIETLKDDGPTVVIRVIPAESNDIIMIETKPFKGRDGKVRRIGVIRVSENGGAYIRIASLICTDRK